MTNGYRVEEEYHEEHSRSLLVEASGVRLYTIDVYMIIPQGILECRESLDAGAPARICYASLPGGCEAVIVEVPGEGRRELVNLRITVDPAGDPFKGSTREARSYCLRRLREALSGVQAIGAPRED